jgi:hypothetical protein
MGDCSDVLFNEVVTFNGEGQSADYLIKSHLYRRFRTLRLIGFTLLWVSVVLLCGLMVMTLNADILAPPFKTVIITTLIMLCLCIIWFSETHEKSASSRLISMRREQDIASIDKIIPHGRLLGTQLTIMKELEDSGRTWNLLVKSHNNTWIYLIIEHSLNYPTGKFKFRGELLSEKGVRRLLVNDLDVYHKYFGTPPII